VNVSALDRVAGDEITPVALAAAGLVGKPGDPVKILGRGEPARAFVVKGCKVSAGARTKIENAGGRIED
jgi:large subunit ribosomal protein L15